MTVSPPPPALRDDILCLRVTAGRLLQVSYNNICTAACLGARLDALCPVTAAADALTYILLRSSGDLDIIVQHFCDSVQYIKHFYACSTPPPPPGVSHIAELAVAVAAAGVMAIECWCR